MAGPSAPLHLGDSCHNPGQLSSTGDDCAPGHISNVCTQFWLSSLQLSLSWQPWRFPRVSLLVLSYW